ncbi:outer membrane protein OmpA [Orrella sp. 11846]|uniref:outer membrane protein OmpA n=1 Tax=Orrella sp. 11846 TaxID=3409913 RepID=UPI003B590B6F
MNKPSKFALALAVAALTATGAASAQTNDNWRSNFGDVWHSNYGLCWQDNFWTPATADPSCVKKADVVSNKVVFNADTFFDFDKYNLKPEGRQLLDQVAEQAKKIDLETIIAVGYTDSIGTVQYNLGLSERRANAVKAYLVSQGIPANRIYTEGKGKADPIATNSTAAGRAKNRRVEIEVVGTRKN